MEGPAVDDHAPVTTDIVAGRNLVVLVSDVALEPTEVDVAGDVVTSSRVCVGHKEDILRCDRKEDLNDWLASLQVSDLSLLGVFGHGYSNHHGTGRSQRP